MNPLPGPPIAWRRLLPFFVLFVGIVSGGFWLKGRPMLPEGPARYNALAAIHLWEHGDLNLPWFQELNAELLEKSKGGAFWVQDAYALGADGKFYPKHSLVTAVLAGPFYGLFGMAGLWLFNQLVLLCILVSLCRLDLIDASVFSRARSALGLNTLSLPDLSVFIIITPSFILLSHLGI